MCGTKEEVREGRRSRRYGWFAQTGLLESHIRGLAACTPPWRSRTRTVPMRWRPLRFLASPALGPGADGDAWVVRLAGGLACAMRSALSASQAAVPSGN